MTNNVNITDPGAETPDMHNETGNTIMTGPYVENLLAVEEAITKAIEDQPVLARAAISSLSPFQYLSECVMEKLPRAHPMEVYRALYIRIHPSLHKGIIKDAFSMGMLAANSARKRTTEWNLAKDLDPANVPVTHNSFQKIQDLKASSW